MNTIPTNLDYTVRHSGFHHSFKEYKYNEQLLMAATDQPDCDFVHANTSPVGVKRFTNVHA